MSRSNPHRHETLKPCPTGATAEKSLSRFRQKATAGLCTFREPRWRQIRFRLGAGGLALTRGSEPTLTDAFGARPQPDRRETLKPVPPSALVVSRIAAKH